MAFKLHTVNLPGNLHAAAVIINKWGWAEYLLSMEFGGSNTVCVLRMPAEKVWQIREDDISYAADPHHDDYTGPEDPYSIDANSRVLASFITGELQVPQGEPASSLENVTLVDNDGVTFVDNTTPPTEVPGATTKKRNGKPKAEKPAEPIKPVEQIHSPDTAGSTDEVDPADLPAWAR